jgi:thiol-disulfide isomerase/thioredoxin
MKKRLYYLSSGFLYTLLGSFWGEYDVSLQFFFMNLIFLIVGIYGGFTQNKTLLIFAIIPFSLLITAFTFYEQLTTQYLLIVAVYFFYFTGYLMTSYLIGNQRIIAFFLTFISIGTLTKYVYPNWVSYAMQQEKQLNLSLDELNLVDSFGTHNLKINLENKFVLLDFWTTSCGVCFEKFPHIDSIARKYKGRDDFKIYAVNVPCLSDTAEDVRRTILKQIYAKGYVFPVALSLDSSETIKTKGIFTYPTVALFDKSGKLIYGGYLETQHKINNIYEIIETALGKK